jgi:hypothetical protein
MRTENPLQLLTLFHLPNNYIMYKQALKYFVFTISIMASVHLTAQEPVAGSEITLQVSAYQLIETNHAPVILTMTNSTAGAPVDAVSNSDLFLRLSSVTPGGTDSEVTARISSGSIPAGTQLTLVSADCTTTNSGGALGTANLTPIVLSAIDQNLVDFIGTCYTGTGYNDGYQMTFEWSPIDLTTNYSLITSASYNITITFTLTPHDGN